jgi:hypothetical protein
MKMQEDVIQRYRQAYPKDKLREMSRRTGINLTRIYRIINGKEMSVGELEIFNNLIDEQLNSRPEYSKLQELIENAFSLYTKSEINKLIDLIERKNFLYSYRKLTSTI